MELGRLWSWLMILFSVSLTVRSLPYDVHWLGGPTTIERDIPSSKQAVDIYCYTGTSKNLLALWQTVKFHIKIKNDEFRQYMGTDPAEVYKDYTEDSYGWSVVDAFSRKVYKSVSLQLFNSTCMAINTKERHSIELQVQRVDLWRVVLMFLGIAVVFSSRTLSGNPVFFYLCGILVGVLASFMVLVYYVSKLLPRKTLTYGVLIGGWTVGLYVVQQAWTHARSLLLQHQAAVLWYCLAAAGASFFVCYRLGPPTDQRTKDLVMWTLQAVGAVLIYFSSEYQEAAAGVLVATLGARHFPPALTRRLQAGWRRRFPPKTSLLTSEQYYEQGARETRRALDELRKHCSSPDCAQWAIMLKLNDSKRFASFVEGDSHLSDEEVLDYEAYAFSPRRKPSPARTPASTPAPSTHPLEISDDDGSETDDDD